MGRGVEMENVGPNVVDRGGQVVSVVLILWLNGPIVGAGHLNERERTAAAFVHDPAWLLRGGGSVPGRQGCLYGTSDLMRQLCDGPLVFVGRKVRDQNVD